MGFGMSCTGMLHNGVRLEGWSERSQKALGWGSLLTGVALTALGIGFMVAACSADVGHTIDGKTSSAFNTQFLLSAGVFTGLVGFGLPTAFFGTCLIRGVPSAPEHYRRARILIAISAVFLLCLGVELGWGSQIMQDALANPDNLPYFDSKAAWEAAKIHLWSLFNASCGIGSVGFAGGIGLGMVVKILSKAKEKIEASAKQDIRTAAAGEIEDRKGDNL